jgi:trehalose 6-phosphate phosphatase
MKQDALQQRVRIDNETLRAPGHDELPPLDQCAILLDIDGTLLDLAPTPSAVWVPPDLEPVLSGLKQRTSGALALVSGRSLADIDRIFASTRFAAVGGHGAEMRISAEIDVVAVQAPPMNGDLKARLAAIAQLDPRILLEDKGYSLALHYRQVPHVERAIYEAVSVIRADLPSVAFEVLPGKSVCEIKPAGITKASGVRELLSHQPFCGRRPMFIGDDVTDETVFAIMPDLRGVAYSVGRHATGVNGVFAAPQDVRHWLAQWLAQNN